MVREVDRRGLGGHGQVGQLKLAAIGQLVCDIENDIPWVAVLTVRARKGEGHLVRDFFINRAAL